MAAAFRLCHSCSLGSNHSPQFFQPAGITYRGLTVALAEQILAAERQLAAAREEIDEYGKANQTKVLIVEKPDSPTHKVRIK